MTCNNALVICKLNDLPCAFKNSMESCPRAHVDAMKHITFSDCISIYDKYADSDKYHKIKVINSVKASLKLVGFDTSTNVDSMTYHHFKKLIHILEEYRVYGRPLSKHTIAGGLTSFRSITAASLREYFEERGYARPIFDIPKYSVPKNKVKIMTIEQECLVEDWMRRCSVSKNPLEQRVFIALWFERLFGVRPGDINRLTWDCIHFEGSTVKLIYKPHKTIKYGGRDDPIIVHPKIWSWVAPFYKKGELLLSRMRRARVQVSRNRAVWDVINQQYREWGICDDAHAGKASYINRRQRITEAFIKDGIRGATAIGKNTPKIQMEHYVSIGEYIA